MTQKKQVLCDLHGIFYLFNCQTPEFDFSSKKFKESCINIRQCGMTLDNWIRITEFKEKLKMKFDLMIDDLEWQEVIEKYKEELNKIV